MANHVVRIVQEVLESGDEDSVHAPKRRHRELRSSSVVMLSHKRPGPATTPMKGGNVEEVLGPHQQIRRDYLDGLKLSLSGFEGLLEQVGDLAVRVGELEEEVEELRGALKGKKVARR
jgi:hypothetical protein